MTVTLGTCNYTRAHLIWASPTHHTTENWVIPSSTGACKEAQLGFARRAVASCCSPPTLARA